MTGATAAPVAFGAGLHSGEAPGSASPQLLYECRPELAARPGIVSTVKGMGETLECWVRYHLGVGFVRLFIYLDDPAEAESLAAFAGDERVVLTPVDDALRAAWESQLLWAKFGEHAEAEVQARQELNGEHAVGLSLREEHLVTWLVHIDADELFSLPPGLGSVVDHFEELTDEGLASFNYVNYEAVPERGAIGNFFLEATLFKRSLAVLPQSFVEVGKPVPCRRASSSAAEAEMASPEVQAELRRGIRWWQARLPHQQYFLGYENGKAAVAVVEGAVPLSVHEWRLPTAALQRRGRHNIKLLDTRGAIQYYASPARILHYISCGFEWWWRKYEVLGWFPDAWFGGQLPIPPCFHLVSRDHSVARDRAAAEAFYASTVVLSDAAERERQLECGLLERILEPRRLLEPSAPDQPKRTSMDDVDDEDDEEV
mmetsp:Transcript_27294/g.89373  ORF Transcript_27294/g.89373 Transcript_27294/m.89373 type:complete len:429 (+) Transcript_27294:418-1704(+)